MSGKRRPFRYTVRQLLACMMIFGVVLGYAGAQLNWKRDRAAARMWLYPLQARSEAASAGRPVPPKKELCIVDDEVDAPWVLALLGERGVSRVELKQEFLGPGSAYNRRKFRSLFPEAEVVFSAPEVDSHPKANGRFSND